MLSLAKIPDAKQAAADIVAFETQMAKAQWSKLDCRDSIKTYNRKTRDELGQARAGIRLESLLHHARRQEPRRRSSSPSPRISPLWRA